MIKDTGLSESFMRRHDKKELTDNLEARYLATRTLVYQLLHAPSTKLHNPVPVIVLVDQSVRESKRQRLQNDGAIVVGVQNIQAIGHGDGMHAAKLQIFNPNLVPYEKVLYMDTDMILTHPIDKIFDDPSTAPRNVGQSFQTASGNSESLPENFVMAASPVTADFSGSTQESIPFYSGLFIYTPSVDLFQYYLKMLGQSGHDLLNYAHRRGGPMPWQNMHSSWYSNWPGDNALDGKTALLNAKGQGRDGYGQSSYSDSDVRKYAQSQRWEMEGYWLRKTEASM
ncbi:hypothetical protein N7454_010068 [Penicillium verhagenii]|nr:hypothetical protein N7454_010068 [Penicillium verhagenii]